jgi:triacylglycerol esterase/lipase EstA (alpha/beta hydrolase family)
MSFRRLALVFSSVALVLSVGSMSAAQAAPKPLPVPYTFLTSAVIAGLGVDADPPGANNWKCKPSKAHPRPVVLMHGILGNKATNWATFAPLLANNGYCVFAMTYGQSPLLPAPASELFGGLIAIEKSAIQLKAFAAKVRKATGASQIDILGHSEGTVVPDYYAKFLGGGKYIHAYVSLAPLWRGTTTAGVSRLMALGTPFGASAGFTSALDPLIAPFTEMSADSAFIKKLRSGGTPAVKGIKYTNIVTKYDELVSPYTSGIQSGMTNHVVQDYCAKDRTEHFEIASDPVAADLVLNALDPAHPRPVPCRLVLPFVGSF